MGKPNNGQSPAQEEVFDAASKVKLDKAHDILDRPEKFAEFFKKVAEDYTPIKTMLTDLMREFILKDSTTREEFKKLVKEAEHEDAMSHIKRFGKGVWECIKVFGALVVGYLLKKYGG